MIRKAFKSDLAEVIRLAKSLWNAHKEAELAQEFAKLLSDSNCAIFLMQSDGETVGFARCRLRHDYVEGTKSSPVGYPEDVYVDKLYRNRGYAKDLTAACEQWAKDKGCSEFAGDCEEGNTESLHFHLSEGFSVANKIICFVKTSNNICIINIYRIYLYIRRKILSLRFSLHAKKLKTAIGFA
ncbi:MAG: GNAT family N-acetyltransferase [Bacillota bacterium]|nr:MAG: GNAT family N-acetyltransferase [Bacillota bacterium]